jgi:DNA-binding transcriptional ArsR family regulator
MHMIELGASVFPLQPGGKKPLIGKSEGGKGFLDASPDPHMAQVFLSNPGKPNYGVAFPVGSDVFVLDLDGGGDDSNPDWKADWQRLYEQLGPPGLTYIVRTASGGRHVYYRWRDDLYGAIPPGDEMLGWTVRKPWKGYLVGPGSIVEGQTYEPVGIDAIADLPEAWAHAALEEAQQRAAKPFIRVGGSGTPVDVKKGHRHAFLRDKARHLVGVGLTGEALFTAVMDINRQMAEPKTEDEVRRAIGDAETKFEQDPIEAPNGRAHRGRAMRTTTDELPELPFYTAVQVEQMPGDDVEWAWHGYLAYGAVTELVGGPKVGKTTLIFGLIEAMVSEAGYLGYATQPGAVVVLTEQGPTSLRAVLRRTKLQGRQDVHFLLHRDIRGEEWPDVVAAVRAHCDRVNARVLIVDTLPAFAGLAGEAENNAGDALEAMEPLMDGAAAGLAILVNRHRRKGGAADIADEGRGSSAFSGAVDVILTLRRKSGMSRQTIRELLAASRFDDTPEELIVELDENEGYIALGTEQTLAALEAEQAVLEALSNSDAHGDVPMCTTKELTEITGTVRRTIERAVKALAGAGMVKRVGEGGRKDPYRWVLAEKIDVHITPPLRGAQVLSSSTFGTGSASPLDADDSSTARPDHVEATWVRPCLDYDGHRSSHRRTKAGWICDICRGEGVA